jgi:hypothetical protein
MKLLLDPKCRSILEKDPSSGYTTLTSFASDILRQYLIRNQFTDSTTYKITTPTGSFQYRANDLPLIGELDMQLPPSILAACGYIFWTRANAKPEEVLRLLCEGFYRNDY